MTAATIHPQPEAIRAYRKAFGQTQTESAAIVHCNIRTWQQWESGSRRMHPAMWELYRIKTSAAGSPYGTGD